MSGLEPLANALLMATNCAATAVFAAIAAGVTSAQKRQPNAQEAPHAVGQVVEYRKVVVAARYAAALFAGG